MPQFALVVVKIMWDKPKIVLAQDWNNHRANWKKIRSNFSAKDISDESALFKHYENLINLDIDKAYKVTFMDQPKVQNLDYKEQF